MARPPLRPYPATPIRTVLRGGSQYGRIAPTVRAPRGPRRLTPGQITRGAHIRGPRGMTPRQAVIASQPARRVGTAATIPPHARTPAVASTRAVSASAVAKAQAQRPAGRPPRGPAISVVPRARARARPRPGAAAPAAATTPG